MHLPKFTRLLTIGDLLKVIDISETMKEHVKEVAVDTGVSCSAVWPDLDLGVRMSLVHAYNNYMGGHR